MPDNLYDALRESHELQRSLLRKLLRSKAGTREREEAKKFFQVSGKILSAAQKVKLAKQPQGLRACTRCWRRGSRRAGPGPPS